MKKFSIFLKRHKRSMLSDKTQLNYTIESSTSREIYIKPVAMLLHALCSKDNALRDRYDEGTKLRGGREEGGNEN